MNRTKILLGGFIFSRESALGLSASSTNRSSFHSTSCIIMWYLHRRAALIERSRESIHYRFLEGESLASHM